PFQEPSLAIFRWRRTPPPRPRLSILSEAFWLQRLEQGDPDNQQWSNVLAVPAMAAGPTSAGKPPAARSDDELQGPRLIELAYRIVQRGPTHALPAVPVETIGEWCSADRGEIEGVRNVENAIRAYLTSANQTRPLA